MIRLQPVVCLAMSMVASSCATTHTPPDPRDAQLSRDIETVASSRAAAGEFSGVVLLARDGEVLLHKAFGLADREQGLANSTSTRFNLASLAKMFTAVAIGQLVEEGLVRWDAPAAEYVSVLADTPAGRTTVHQLLTHTSGVPDLAEDLFYAPPARLSGYLDFLRAAELNFEPGSSRAYSNGGFVLLGLIVEAASGERFESRVQRTVFERAGMNATSYAPDTPILPLPAVPYKPADGGSWERAMKSRIPGGAHGPAYATAGDLMKFYDALCNGRLVSTETAQTLTTPRAGSSSAYGFGTMSIEKDRLVGHSGGDTGASADSGTYWESGYTLIVLSNLSGPAAFRVSLPARELIEKRIHEE